MLRASKDHWVRESDLVESPLGREDSAELIEQCLDYFAERSTGEYPVVKLSPATDRKTKDELLSAHVQSSIRHRLASGDLRRLLAEAHATIDRLLAFVPGRAQELEESRVDDLATQLAVKASELIPSAKLLRATVAPETDVDSMACHRIVLTLAVPETLDPLSFATATAELHRWLADNSPTDEYQAVRLIVEPQLIPERESR